MELLKQPQYAPYDAIDQCISIFCGTRGFLDDLERSRVHAFEHDLLEHFRGPKKELRQQLAEAKSFKGIEDAFAEAVSSFKATWQPG